MLEAFLPQAGPVTLTATARGKHDQDQHPEFFPTSRGSGAALMACACGAVSGRW